MRILLIELPIDFWNRPGRHYLPNPGTLSVGTYLKSNGYDVRILDTYAEGMDWDSLINYIKEERPDVIGSSTYTCDIYGRVLLSRLIKQASPSTITVFGGTHITLAPEETLRLAGSIDYAVLGEGEVTMLELIRAIESGGNKPELSALEGIAYLDGGRYNKTTARPLVNNLDELPLPDYSLVPMAKYHNSFFPYPADQGLSICSSRGCVARCNFCSESVLWQHRWRGRSAKSVVEELMQLNKYYGKRAFLFNDDNFLFDRQRNVDFIKEMSRSGLKVEFRVGARVDTLLRDRDLLKDLRRVGLTALQIGIESYGQGDLDALNKDYREEQIRELSFYLKSIHIPMAIAFVIVGNREDGKKTLREIIKRTKSCGFGMLHISPLTPWPGTRLYRDMEAEGLIKVNDYRLYNFKNAIMPTKYLGLSALDKLRVFLFVRWWFSFTILARNLADRHRRNYFIRALLPAAFSSIQYYVSQKLGLWKLYRHNRMIERIYNEHLALRK